MTRRVKLMLGIWSSGSSVEGSVTLSDSAADGLESRIDRLQLHQALAQHTGPAEHSQRERNLSGDEELSENASARSARQTASTISQRRDE